MTITANAPTGDLFSYAHNQALANRIRAKVEINDKGCWIWKGPIDPGNGYGRILYNGSKQYTHRLSYIAHRGPIDAGLNILHRCDCKTCANPDHAYQGTQADNSADYVARTETWKRGAGGKLRAAQVLGIVHGRYEDGMSYLALSEKFHISCQAVSNICRGRTHAKLTGIDPSKPAPTVKTSKAKRLVAKADRKAKKQKGKGK